MTMEEYQAIEETHEIKILRNFFEAHQSKGYTVSQLLIYVQAFMPETSSIKLHRAL